MDVREEKQRLKNAVQERIARMTERDRRMESSTLCTQICKNVPEEARTVCAYMPLKDEADIRPALQILLDRGVALYLPCCEGRTSALQRARLVFRRARDLSSLVSGAFGILEPSTNACFLDPAVLDLVLVPGRAFDRSGARLGRGNAGYDVWIRAQRTANPCTRFWGIALECQIIDHIPMESHDEPVDTILTARGLAEKEEEK